ncbi:MAG: RcnB family protein [Novosphingobium sp.]
MARFSLWQSAVAVAALAASGALAVAPAVAQDARGGPGRGQQAQAEGRGSGGWRDRGSDSDGRGDNRGQARGGLEQRGGGDWQARAQARQQQAQQQAQGQQESGRQQGGAQAGGWRGQRSDQQQRQGVAGSWRESSPRPGVYNRDNARPAPQRNGVERNRVGDDNARRGWNGDVRRDNQRYDRGRADNRYQGGYRASQQRWNNNWRRDNRYDWQSYRGSNRQVYRLGNYYAPYRNYSYRRLSAGLFLDNLFFGQRYWISDPWQYRLPAVDGSYRWVRYYDDVLLIDTYSGEVVDVVYDFFW